MRNQHLNHEIIPLKLEIEGASFGASHRAHFREEQKQGKNSACHNDFFFAGAHYASRSEAACGALMEKYITGFKIIQGETAQIPLSRNSMGDMRHADFQVDNVIIEYHPPRFWREGRKSGDFPSMREYFHYRRELDACETKAEREAFTEKTKAKLTRHYYERRLDALRRNPEHAGKELIVATTPEDFYNQVMRRFGGPMLPSIEQFLTEFLDIQAAAQPASRRSWGRRGRRHGDRDESSESQRAA